MSTSRITTQDRYTKITDLHRLTQLPTIEAYINNLSEKFYTHKLKMQQTEVTYNSIL